MNKIRCRLSFEDKSALGFEKYIEGGLKDAASNAVKMASGACGPGGSVIISIEQWGGPNRLVWVRPSDSIDTVERNIANRI